VSILRSAAQWMRSGQWYRGWHITYHAGHPVTSQYRAAKSGVTINTRTRSGLLDMIDMREGK
jgi:hypothetical protein